MIKYCKYKWDVNKDKLEQALRTTEGLDHCDYEDLVKMVVDYILNGDVDNNDEYKWDSDKITKIDDGDYQGTLLFLIPQDTYQPSEWEYLMTYVGYGSCSGCDTLQAIQNWGDGLLTDDQVKDYMKLCLHIVSDIIKPYNGGWRNEDKFEPCTEEVEAE